MMPPTEQMHVDKQQTESAMALLTAEERISFLRTPENDTAATTTTTTTTTTTPE